MVLGILIGACMPCGFGLRSRPWMPVQVSGVITVVTAPPAWTAGHVAPDHLGACPRLGRRSAGTHPHSRHGLCGRSVDVDASDTHATATSSVCEPFQGTEGVSATNCPGVGGRGWRDPEYLSTCHHQVQQSFCTTLAIEDFCNLYQYWPQLIKPHEG